MASKLERYIRFMPKIFKARTNPMLSALLEAWAGADDEIEEQLKNTKAQIFVKTAEGVFLDRLSSNFGVSRPTQLGLLDEDFQELVPNLSVKAKQIAKSFYDTMDIFWGPLYSRANIASSAFAPFDVSIGESFTVILDGYKEITVTLKLGDIAVNGAATADEMTRFLNSIEGLEAETLIDISTNGQYINIRTETPGARGSIEIVAPNSLPGMGFLTGKRVRITDIPQRTVLYQINPGEIILEIPAILPVLRRVLKGSHHFHEDSTIEPPIPPSNAIWRGSFLASTTKQPFLPSSKKAILESEILRGSVLNQITVVNSSEIPMEAGSLIFNYGKANVEQPVNYITVPNSKTILIDPGYTFIHNHSVGSEINYLVPGQITPYKPRKTGLDLSVYFTSPSGARIIVQNLLKELAAAGIVVTFLILLPKYKYLYDNPYSE